MGDLQVRGFAGLFVSNRRHACYLLKGGQRVLAAGQKLIMEVSQRGWCKSVWHVNGGTSRIFAFGSLSAYHLVGLLTSKPGFLLRVGLSPVCSKASMAALMVILLL
jgi:hypothetical protein